MRSVAPALWFCLAVMLSPLGTSRSLQAQVTAPSAEPTAADAPSRWREATYGISLLPPNGASQWEGPRVLWADPRGFTVSFELVFSKVPFNLEQAAGATVVQMGFARSLPRVQRDEQGQPIKPRPERIGERPGIKMYFDVEEEDADDWFYGQALVMIEPHAAAVLKLKSEASVAEPARDAFERVLASVEVPLARELDEQRGRQVEAGDAWLQQVTPQRVREALPDQRLYRMIHRGQDVGYMRLLSTGDPDELRSRGHEPPGTLVLIHQRQVLDGQTIDTEYEAYASDDGEREVWSHRMSLRPQGDDDAQGGGLPTRVRGPAEKPRTWTQTGIRGDQQLTAGRGGRQQSLDVNAVTVVTEAPPPGDAVAQIESHEQFLGKPRARDVVGTTQVSEWRAPDKAYLPQVMLPVFAGLLPNEPAVYAFTAYHVPTGGPGLRTVKVIPQPDGGKLVRDRPTPRDSPVLHLFDAEGQLVRRVHPNGLVIQPTTPEELAKVWRDD
jgi:hypothetical protein